ncbi:autotransporter outer membrane beta-barrel domain-containing protein [Microbulbifer sp. CAU 1566]|uniref:autotransporter family protein n=1 Tax=Microbulbifer sp. CAU 1566 TaxID=2933269 RepID=UPI0020066898|nr:autotransporter outer membrane beta-barrel domain-containing protein [Microbulbifer sp. CAU 1566]MCK7599009.1 autotransporter outer membrane beta-barrel domain-containing protein [Microbulbifer sp. CAU 1566]
MSYPRAASAFNAGAPALRITAFGPTLPALIVALPVFLAPATGYGQVLFGSEDNHYTLNSDNRANIDSGQRIDGGAGNDRLSIQGVSLSNPSRLQHWETISLEHSADLTLDSSLVLGGSDALPGLLEIDSSSRLLLPYFSAGILPGSGQPLSVINHGVINMSGDNTANSLLIRGDYIGSGSILMDMVAGGDDSLADRLIISGGRASGSTQLLFNRLTGNGADTDNGILVVEARDGGSTTNSAFFMDGSVSAGPYEYFLFRGSQDPEDANNWYLRSNLQPSSTPVTQPADTQSSIRFSSVADDASVASDAQASLSPSEGIIAAAPESGAAPITLYRPEIPLYAQAKSLARLSSLQEIGSYHKRRGEQRSWFDGINDDWLRVHHMSTDYNWSGDIDNRFDGSITGIQLGTNLWSGPTCTGGARETGLFVGSTRASGDVSGFARGYSDYSAGQNQLTSHHIGFYFNDYRPDMGYFDFTAKVAHLTLESRSSRGIGDTISGPQLTLSVEKGFTWQAAEHFNLEPQLQVIANYSNLSAFNDGISWVEPDMTPEANFRVGLRGYNTDTAWLDGNLRVYLFGNVWHTLGGNDQLLFDGNLQTDLERQATWGEFGGGAVLLQSKYGSAFFNLGYQRSLDDLNWSGGSASLGFNWAW